MVEPVCLRELLSPTPCLGLPLLEWKVQRQPLLRLALKDSSAFPN